MLQIASGKLFTREPEHRNELRSVLYSNLRLGRETIQTAAGKILPTDIQSGPQAIVYEMLELIEKTGQGRGVLVSHTIKPYLTDFAAVVSFGFNVTCTTDPILTARLISGERGPVVQSPPSKMIRRVFDPEVWCGNGSEQERFVSFVRDLMGLERVSFLAAMRAIRTFVTGMHRMADDVTLAYTLLVASLESLAQGFDGHRTTWEDYDERKRNIVDEALSDAPDQSKEKLRQALLDIEHTSLARRFQSFVIETLQPSFFREEAQGAVGPIGRSELPGALRQAYSLRSRYIHNWRSCRGVFS